MSDDHPRDTTETLRRLLALVTENNLAELSVTDDGFTISVKGLSDQRPPPQRCPWPCKAPPTCRRLA